jgi:hypothetical protein
VESSNNDDDDEATKQDIDGHGSSSPDEEDEPLAKKLLERKENEPLAKRVLLRKNLGQGKNITSPAPSLVKLAPHSAGSGSGSGSKSVSTPTTTKVGTTGRRVTSIESHCIRARIIYKLHY